MYIIALLFGNDKADKDFKIVSNKTTKNKLYTINYAYPVKESLKEKKYWYDSFKDYAKFYKNKNSAINLIRRLEKEYNITGYHIIEIDENVTSKVYNGCPNCGSYEVIETFSTQYNRPLQFDPETKTMTAIDDAEDTGFGTIDRYACIDCGFDLSDFKFDYFNNL